ncbi:MAG: transglutaminase domain-containing protein [Verrucomicrobiota bacterium]
MQALSIPLNNHESDATQILRFMRDVHARAFADPMLRQAAVTILHACSVGNNDKRGQVDCLTRFVKDNVVYVNDPVGSELITDPRLLLREIIAKKKAYGDCDDHCVLLASLLGAVGIKTKFIGVKLTKEGQPTPNHFNHVIIAAEVGGQWEDIDPCFKRMGMQPVYRERQEIVNADSPGGGNQIQSLAGFFDFVGRIFSAPFSIAGALLSPLGIGTPFTSIANTLSRNNPILSNPASIAAQQAQHNVNTSSWLSTGPNAVSNPISMTASGELKADGAITPAKAPNSGGGLFNGILDFFGGLLGSFAPGVPSNSIGGRLGTALSPIARVGAAIGTAGASEIGIRQASAASGFSLNILNAVRGVGRAFRPVNGFAEFSADPLGVLCKGDLCFDPARGRWEPKAQPPPSNPAPTMGPAVQTEYGWLSPMTSPLPAVGTATPPATSGSATPEVILRAVPETGDTLKYDPAQDRAWLTLKDTGETIELNVETGEPIGMASSGGAGLGTVLLLGAGVGVAAYLLTRKAPRRRRRR